MTEVQEFLIVIGCTAAIVTILGFVLWKAFKRRDRLFEGEDASRARYTEILGARFLPSGGNVTWPLARVAVYEDCVIIGSVIGRIKIAPSEIKEMKEMKGLLLLPGVRLVLDRMDVHQVILWAKFPDRVIAEIGAIIPKRS